MPRMPLSELKALLDSERNDALAATRASKLSVERSDAADYDLGDMAKDMPAPDGRSRAVSTAMRDNLVAQLAPFTPEPKRFFAEWRDAGAAPGRDEVPR